MLQSTWQTTCDPAEMAGSITPSSLFMTTAPNNIMGQYMELHSRPVRSYSGEWDVGAPSSPQAKAGSVTCAQPGRDTKQPRPGSASGAGASTPQLLPWAAHAGRSRFSSHLQLAVPPAAPPAPTGVSVAGSPPAAALQVVDGTPQELQDATEPSVTSPTSPTRPSHPAAGMLAGDGGSSSTPTEQRVWEVRVSPITHHVTGEAALLVVLHDCSRHAQVEQLLCDLTESQISIVASILPKHIMQHLTTITARSSSGEDQSGTLNALARTHEEVTLLFMDITGFTCMSKQVAPADVMQFLNALFSLFDALVTVHGVHKVETAGDCYIGEGMLLWELHVNSCTAC